MKYKKIIIKSYKGIKRDINIDIHKNRLIPIIGINECGKTTILEAIFSFDRFNDSSNGSRHLENVENLYSTDESNPRIEAEVLVNRAEFKDVITRVKRKYEADGNPKKQYLEKLEAKIENSEKDDSKNLLPISFGRNLKNLRYYFIDQEEFSDIELNNEFLFELLSILPYILYFDDFKDRIDERILIETNDDSTAWINIIQRVFVLTNEKYSVFDLPIKNESIRKSIISEVETKLNEELLKEWPQFSITDKKPLEIKINYTEDNEKQFLEFFVVEKIIINNKERERYFKLGDRSKGFYWYFNFIMKLIFNTKSRSLYDHDTIYLLDEPGSYLHSSAQTRLTKRLKDIAKKNVIIYCTHSPYLLSPNYIAINSIKVVEKYFDGEITLKTAFETSGRRNKKSSAYQPIYDALDIKPLLLDYDINNVILVEGIYDYFSFEMFKKEINVNFFPCVNADSIINSITYMIFLEKNYLVLWDNDEMGAEQLKKAKGYFGEIEARKFHLLPKKNGTKKCRLETLYLKSEIQDYKKFRLLPSNQSFEKVVLDLYYNNNREQLIDQFFPFTSLNFQQIIEEFESKLYPH